MSNQVQTTAEKVNNPYSSPSIISSNQSVSSNTLIEAQRATTEVMTAFEVAKRFPRSTELAAEKILKECSRPTLAELSTYSYSKGGQEISGATIRLLEAIARSWGNIRFGWQVIESTKQQSSVRAYAVDLEDNILRETVFDIRHWRDTKKGGYAITDERDIYELQANMAMRRVRGCLEGLIPRDVIEMALEQCEITNKTSVDTSPDAIKKMVNAFEKIGINQAMIEAKFQGLKISAFKPIQIVTLRKNFAALKDGLAKVEDLFDLSLADKKDVNNKQIETVEQPDLKKKIAEKAVAVDNDGVIQDDIIEQDAPPAPDPIEKLTAPQTPLDIEREIRKAINAAISKEDAAFILTETYADGLAFIKEKDAASYSVLKSWLDTKISKLPN